jgi:DNA-binding response OmpR family regulator
MIKILLLEDDELFADSLIDFLEESNYEVSHEKDGESFLNATYENNFQLYLMDINVPKINGIDTLKYLRESNNQTPVIYLTSYKDKIKLNEGFLAGCDDYLTKPFDMDELLLRITALLKRSNIALNNITLGSITYDINSNSLQQDDKIIESSTKVVELFKLCYENNNKIVTKEMIIDRLWGYNEEYSEGSLRVYMSKLLKIFPNQNILNIKGVGYQIKF